jgi:hypothetical protein
MNGPLRLRRTAQGMIKVDGAVDGSVRWTFI